VYKAAGRHEQSTHRQPLLQASSHHFDHFYIAALDASPCRFTRWPGRIISSLDTTAFSRAMKSTTGLFLVALASTTLQTLVSAAQIMRRGLPTAEAMAKENPTLLGTSPRQQDGPIIDDSYPYNLFLWPVDPMNSSPDCSLVATQFKNNFDALESSTTGLLWRNPQPLCDLQIFTAIIHDDLVDIVPRVTVPSQSIEAFLEMVSQGWSATGVVRNPDTNHQTSICKNEQNGFSEGKWVATMVLEVATLVLCQLPPGSPDVFIPK
jgi:hypothetical protein